MELEPVASQSRSCRFSVVVMTKGGHVIFTPEAETGYRLEALGIHSGILLLLSCYFYFFPHRVSIKLGSNFSKFTFYDVSQVYSTLGRVWIHANPSRRGPGDGQ